MNERGSTNGTKIDVEEFWVKLHGCKHRFNIPKSVQNYYQFRGNDGLVCELKELKNKTENKKVNQIILIDIEGITDLVGDIPDAPKDFYEIEKYDYLLIKIKKVIKSWP